MTSIWVETRAGGAYQATDAPVWAAADRGLAYGDGLFETVRIEQGQPLFLGRHLNRLQNGLEALSLATPWPVEALARRCVQVCQDTRVIAGVLKLTITRGVGLRGYEPPVIADPVLVIQAWPDLPSPVKTLSAVRAPWRIDPASPLNRLKSLSALDKVMARRFARQAGADDALFENTAGHLTESTVSNLFIVRSGRLITPPEGSGLLPGITRELILEFAPAWGYDMTQAEMTADDLSSADEAFLTNSVAEITPLVKFEARPIGNGQPGPLTKSLAQRYEQLRLTGGE